MAIRRSARAVIAALAVVSIGLTGACSDEDGDGATTDEEIQDLEEGGDKAEKEIEEEVDGQDRGTNSDGE